MSQQQVYFLRLNIENSPIKIGLSYDPADRARCIETQLPFQVEVITMVPGNLALERNVQDCFADAHLQGEWFRPVPRLLEAIEKLKAGAAIHEVVDLSDRRGNTLGKTMRATIKRHGQKTVAA